MKMCEYQYYENKGQGYFPMLMCKITESSCPFRKKCNVKKKWLPLDNDYCGIREEEKLRQIPNGAYLIKFEKKGYIYIDFGGKSIKVKNTIGNIGQEYIYVKENNGEYEISLKPF